MVLMWESTSKNQRLSLARNWQRGQPSSGAKNSGCLVQQLSNCGRNSLNEPQNFETKLAIDNEYRALSV